MIQIEWTDRNGDQRTILVEAVNLWEARGGGPEHPDGTVIEGYRNRSGVLQLDADDRVGIVMIREVK